MLHLELPAVEADEVSRRGLVTRAYPEVEVLGDPRVEVLLRVVDLDRAVSLLQRQQVSDCVLRPGLSGGYSGFQFSVTKRQYMCGWSASIWFTSESRFLWVGIEAAVAARALPNTLNRPAFRLELPLASSMMMLIIFYPRCYSPASARREPVPGPVVVQSPRQCTRKPLRFAAARLEFRRCRCKSVRAIFYKLCLNRSDF